MNQIIDTNILSDMIYRKTLARIVASQIASEGVSPKNVSKIVASVLSDMEVTFKDLKVSLESENPRSEKYALKKALISMIEESAQNYAFEHISIETDDPIARYEIAAEEASKDSEDSGVDAIIADMLKFKDNVDVQYAAKFILGLIKDTQDDKLKHELDEDKLDEEDADSNEQPADDGGLSEMDGNGGDNPDNPFGDGGDNGQSQGNNQGQDGGDQSNPFNGGAPADNNGGNANNAAGADNNVDNNAAQNAPKRESNPFA